MNAPEKLATMGVYRKLQEARIRLNSQAIKKGARNEFAKYNYMELADFLIPTQQIFQDLGLCGIVSFAPDIATLTITDMDTGAQVHIHSPMSTAALKGCHEVQNLGAVQTYLRRYLWVAAMEIVEHDAIDSAEPAKPAKQETQKPASVARVEFDKLPEDEQQFLRDLAIEVIGAKSISAMYDAYQKAKASLDADEQVAFWSLFDSKQRSAIKAEGVMRENAAKTKPTLAEAM